MTVIGVTPEIALSVIVGGIVAVARMIIWLVGLVVAIRGSRSKDRAAVLRAYSSVHNSQRLARHGRTRRAKSVGQADDLPGRNNAHG